LLQPDISVNGIITLVVAGLIATLSKYLLRIKKKHLFNPAAITAVILDLAGSGAVIWWVGSLVLAPFAFIIGILIVRKLRRFDLFLPFVLASLVVMLIYGLLAQQSVSDVMMQSITSWPLIFFGTIMLTEPLTTPPTKKFHIIYGLLVGALFAAQFKIGNFYATPELALVIGNIFSFFVSSKQRLVLTFNKKTELAPYIYEFSFTPNEKLKFKPGQYLEWTLGHHNADDRGIRRFFTITSSPTEDDIKLTVRTSDKSSTFKKRLLEMQKGEKLMAGSLGGEFTLPEDETKKLAFIAGGIGLTPFRSMVEYLVDKNQKRDIIFFYVCNAEQDFVYKDLFKKAETVGVKMVYIVTKPENCSKDFKGKTGYITKETLTEEVPDLNNRMFFLSGPDAMVQSYKKLLQTVKIPATHIVTDYFPGF